ncbi:MAG: RecX family transcriptional regulator [Deltaproteobacteria bacterium]|nr:RecX family transcriptional regulator [Deltaproteobacteria bacterium]
MRRDEKPADRGDESKRRARRYRVESEEALKDLALGYVTRFPGSVAHVRRYLEKKRREAIALGETTEAASRAWPDGVIATLIRVRLLDDVAYAESRARTLHRRGRPLRVIERDLRQRGVSADDARAALEALSEAASRPDLAAAIRLARRRRLGPWADEATRREKREKHLATLARQGFTFEIARRVVDAADADALEALVDMI